jgi:DNA repair protein RecO (recombination protein O)
MMRSSQRVQLVRGYLLHQRPWRDSSLIIEVFSADFGRLTTFARAARGPRTRFSGLQPFRPLLLSWSGRGDAPALTGAEGDGAPPAAMAPTSLLSAWYLNELLLKLTVPHDPQPELYAQYAATLERMRAGAALETTLRHFELCLLELLGFGMEFRRECAAGRAVRPEAYYHFTAGEGVRESAGSGISGRLLLMLADGELPTDPEDQRAVRALLRAALDHCLEGRELRTRTVARAVARMERVSG